MHKLKKQTWESACQPLCGRVYHMVGNIQGLKFFVDSRSWAYFLIFEKSNYYKHHWLLLWTELDHKKNEIKIPQKFPPAWYSHTRYS